MLAAPPLADAPRGCFRGNIFIRLARRSGFPGARRIAGALLELRVGGWEGAPTTPSSALARGFLAEGGTL